MIIAFALLNVTERLADVMMVVVENAIVVLDSNASKENVFVLLSVTERLVEVIVVEGVAEPVVLGSSASKENAFALLNVKEIHAEVMGVASCVAAIRDTNARIKNARK